MPFSRFFPAGRADPVLIDRLTSQANLQGLLRMAVGGLQRVMQRGSFALPPSVASATEHFKKEADPIRGFIEERIAFTHPHNSPFTNRTEIYTAYTTWTAMNGFHQMSAQRFYESFYAACIDTSQFPMKSITRQGFKGYLGITLN